MATQASAVQGIVPSTSRIQCWTEALILSLGIPAMIWALSKIISISIPAAVHGSPEQRYLFWFGAGVVVEWVFVIGLWFPLKRRGSPTF